MKLMTYPKIIIAALFIGMCFTAAFGQICPILGCAVYHLPPNELLAINITDTSFIQVKPAPVKKTNTTKFKFNTDSLITANKSLTLKLQQTEHKFRILQSDYNRAKSQLKTLNKQIEGLKSDTSRLAANAELNDQLYNECLDDVMDKMMDLQEIAFIVWGKKLGKVKRVKAVIDDKSCKQ